MMWEIGLGTVVSEIELLVPIQEPQLIVITFKLWHIDTFWAIFGSLNPYGLLSEVQLGLGNVASQIQTHVALVSTTAHSANY